jgi:hypothetical protein
LQFEKIIWLIQGPCHHPLIFFFLNAPTALMISKHIRNPVGSSQQSCKIRHHPDVLEWRGAEEHTARAISAYAQFATPAYFI